MKRGKYKAEAFTEALQCAALGGTKARIRRNLEGRESVSDFLRAAVEHEIEEREEVKNAAR